MTGALHFCSDIINWQIKLHFRLLKIMNKREKSASNYKKNVHKREKKSDHSEEASVKKNMKLDIGNDSPQHSYDTRVCGHSTPNVKKEYIHDIEDSPELDYRCSPILLPCTQDGGNEISWDWQTSNSKNSNEKSKPQSSHIETPKRTKHLQKKRNSNSPLLQKPLKRKQVRMENIENIGKLTAELKALTERMKNMQENYNSRVTENGDDTECVLESKLLIELDTEIDQDIMIRVTDNDKSKVDTIAVNNNTKKGSSYEDLFDDSIDDSMVRCSQEIEEKLNLCQSKGNEIIEVNVINEKKEKDLYCVTFTNSSASSRSINNSKNSLSDTSGQLKTYSNNSSKISLASNFSFSSLKNTSVQRDSFKNSIIHTPNKKLQEKNTSDFPDDSFDDCLATCVEDDKLLMKLSEYDFSASNSGRNPSHSKKKEAIPSSNKQTSSNLFSEAIDTLNNAKSNSCQSSKLIADYLVGEFEVTTDKESVQTSFPCTTSLENRKFFKTKSLSDQCFYQNKNGNLSSKTVKTSNCVVPNRKRVPSNSSVSTTYPVVTSQNSYQTNNLASINGAENAHALDRLKGKEDRNCIVKYKSTSNLNSIKEAVKQSLSVQCTPEEIERKRQEAKMRLEAKRKLQQSGRMGSAPNKEIC